ncbi:MAG: hypothetical protein AB7V26_05140 [Lysobacterales bacterium]
MPKRICMCGLVAILLSIGGAVAAPLNALAGHVLAMEVKVDGEKVMTPMVELVAGAPAVVEVQAAEPDGHYYSLHLLLKDQQRVGKVENAIAVEAQLFEGDAKRQDLLVSPTLFIRPGQNGSAQISGERGRIEISVLSHAIRSHVLSEADYEMALAGCAANSSPSIATATGGFNRTTEESSCCAVACNGPGGTLRCC